MARKQLSENENSKIKSNAIFCKYLHNACALLPPNVHLVCDKFYNAD